MLRFPKISFGWTVLTVLLVATAVLAGLNGMQPGFIDKMISALYESNPNVMDSGGGMATSSNYMTVASIGQPAIGTATSSMYKTEAGFFTTDVTPGEDSDGDGVPNDEDNCPSVSNADQSDSDGDDVGNVCDNCPNAANSGQEDNDGDDVGNACDNCRSVANSGQEDTDSDGFGNVCDNCPSVSNPSQADNDGDTVGDACDNCWAVANANQTDTDHDCPAPPYTSDPLCGDACAAGCLRGDANCDGNITPGDALCAFWRAILGSFQAECLCDCSEQAAEVNCDGAITPGDALCIFWRAILGSWTDDCDCLSAKTVATHPKVDHIAIQSVQGTPGEQVAISITVEKPRNLDAFALNLSYPADLLQFERISSTSATQDWIAVEGRMADEGRLIIAGFNIDGISSKGSVALFEMIFTVRQGVSGQGELALTDLTDDLAGAQVSKGSVIVREVPTDFGLSQNYPNPFNPQTTISYALPVQSEEFRVKGGDGTLNSTLSTLHVTLKIFNALGQEVATLVDELKEPGYYTVTWDGQDGLGNGVPSGIYFYKLESGDFAEAKRMVLIR